MQLLVAAGSVCHLREQRQDGQDPLEPEGQQSVRGIQGSGDRLQDVCQAWVQVSVGVNKRLSSSQKYHLVEILKLHDQRVSTMPVLFVYTCLLLLQCVHLHKHFTGLSVAGGHSPQPVGLGGEPDGLGRVQQQLVGLGTQQVGETHPRTRGVQLGSKQ